MSDVAISVRNLTKTYKLYRQPVDRLKEALHPLKKTYHKNFNALNDVSFDIKRGETVGIIGRNGSGKSTLLKLITGVVTPTSGRAIVRGRVAAILELGAGFNGEMSGLDNIYLNNTINGIPAAETKKRVQQIVDFAELGDFIYQPLKSYSSGMKARLAFAAAINIEPDILIVDEALSVGDAAFQRKCFAKMEQIREAGATILFVSHSEGSIVSLCSRAIWISNGEQIIDGAPKLVTGLYMKNASKKVIKKAAVQKEYACLVEKDNNAKKQTAVDEKNKTDTIKEIKEKQSIKTDKSRLDGQPTILEEYFDPKLKPTSTIYYEEKGARISDVKITTLDGREVNILKQGEKYTLHYKVNFTDMSDKVILGVSVCTKSGVVLFSGNYPGNKNYESMLANEVSVSWEFLCSFLEGHYFFTVGVFGESNMFMARIKDAYMCRVVNNNNVQLNGLIDVKLKGAVVYV